MKLFITYTDTQDGLEIHKFYTSFEELEKDKSDATEVAHVDMTWNQVIQLKNTLNDMIVKMLKEDMIKLLEEKDGGKAA